MKEWVKKITDSLTGESKKIGLNSDEMADEKSTTVARTPGKKLPDRYSIQQDEDGPSIICMETPNVRVKVRRGFTVPASAVKKQKEQSIFLDGAAQGEPFMDHERQIYNLDHHEGCVRSFTYSTCEQSIVMIRKGLNLSEKKWVIWANDPDLDTVLSIWVLLNHIHLRKDDPYVPREILPILRLEGMIDGLGLEMQDLVAFPPRLHKETMNRIAYLRSDEMRIKSEGKWDEVDFTEYTLNVLNRIDNMVYHPEDFKDFKVLEELARVDISEKSSAVVYRADMGIYEVEEYLGRLYEKKPTLVILQKNQRTYTIRKSDMFSPIDIENLYDRLNLMDPSVSWNDAGNRWGGSGEIGGSPRKSGTSLSPASIVETCKQAFHRPSLLEKVVRFGWAAFFGLLYPAIGWMFIAVQAVFNAFSGTDNARLLSGIDHIFIPISLLYVLIFCILSCRKHPWFYGFRMPAFNDWWYVLPLAIIGAVAGGNWMVDLKSEIAGFHWSETWLIILIPAGLEILFRGALHGQLAQINHVQLPDSPWFLSIPVVFTSFLYGLVIVIIPLESYFLLNIFEGPTEATVKFVGGTLFGIAQGVIRERSSSIFPGILISIMLCVILGTIPDASSLESLSLYF